MKVAIIGSGIAGLTAAHYLNKSHDVTVFESADRIGGHTATIDVDHAGHQYAIDTGFIVFNDWTYPNFIRLLDDLEVKYKSTNMSFSVSCDATGLEYAGSNLNTLFAQRSNAVSPKFWLMLKDIVRFNREAVDDMENQMIALDTTLGQYLCERKYSAVFIEKYLAPMAAAIWSSDTGSVLDFPMLFFTRFFKNHGLLAIKNRPQWYVIEGGSRNYLEPLTCDFAEHIHTGVRIHRLTRNGDQVSIAYSSSRVSKRQEYFDALVIATHSDQALTLLEDPNSSETSILSAMPYRTNEVVLHTDESLLPKNKLTWSSWNYRLRNLPRDSVSINNSGSKQHIKQMATLTYNMNILQNIKSDTTFCVSLNQTELIDSHKIIQSFEYSHPVFTLEGMDAQQRWAEIAGTKRTWYCGAYWHNGFHEDGVVSALRVVDSINEFAEHAVNTNMEKCYA